MGLVVIDLITSPVVSWRGWETPPPPPPHSTEAQLSFFAQPQASEDLSLCVVTCCNRLLSLCLRLVDGLDFLGLFFEFFLSVS